MAQNARVSALWVLQFARPKWTKLFYRNNDVLIIVMVYLSLSQTIEYYCFFIN